jgi:hypothetical protein
MNTWSFLGELTNESIQELKKEFLKYESGNEIILQMEVKPDIISIDKTDLPSDWLNLNDDCKKFIKSRRIYDAPNLPKDLTFYFSRKEKRLVIPWKENNEIKYYQTRALYKNQTPKYKFPFNSQKYVFGLDSIDPDFKYIFYTEGALDSIWIKNGIAIGGLNLTSNQKEILESYFLNVPILLTDNPWQDKASTELILKISKINPSQQIFLWPKHIKEKDINEYVVKNNDTKLFFNEDFLILNIMTAMKAAIKLTF